MNVKPFKIEMGRQILDDLRRRLENTRWPDEIAESGWEYGTNLSYLKELISYWQREFDWRKQEAALNQFSHYRAKIDGFGVHFIHERGKGKYPLPIILTHGYPDSFIRFLKVIPMLTDPERYGGDAEDSLDVIIPSLPGYGFSDRPRERGMSPMRIAALFHRLMTEGLGYKRFAAQGGDWGSGVTRQLALDFPESLVAIHLTDVPAWMYINDPPPDLSEAERLYFANVRQWAMEEGGYAMIQSTKPQTLAYAMNDSPAGLAAWMIEKFRAWSDCGGDLESRFSKDELLTNLTIYWATETANSAFRIYYESQRNPAPNAKERIRTPTAVAIFPKDLAPAPAEFAERVCNVQRWTEMPRGGHFAAWEEPELFVEDLRAFFRTLREQRYRSHEKKPVRSRSIQLA
jgi:pimeloyl-ACP methyl ester carboxylesterase